MKLVHIPDVAAEMRDVWGLPAEWRKDSDGFEFYV